MLLGQMEAKLEIWECIIALIFLYIGFLALAAIALKYNSRKV